MGTVPGPGGPQPSNGRLKRGPRAPTRKYTPLTAEECAAIRAVRFCFCGRRIDANGNCKTGNH